MISPPLPLTASTSPLPSPLQSAPAAGAQQSRASTAATTLRVVLPRTRRRLAPLERRTRIFDQYQADRLLERLPAGVLEALALVERPGPRLVARREQPHPPVALAGGGRDRLLQQRPGDPGPPPRRAQEQLPQVRRARDARLRDVAGVAGDEAAVLGEHRPRARLAQPRLHAGELGAGADVRRPPAGRGELPIALHAGLERLGDRLRVLGPGGAERPPHPTVPSTSRAASRTSAAASS